MTTTEYRPFLIGERVSLRAVEEHDLTRIVGWVNDPAIRENILRQFPLDLRGETDWYNNRDRTQFPNDFVFAIVLNKDGRHIGNMGVHGIDWINRFAGTGTLIGEKEEWSKGYAVEAKRLLLKYLFNTLGLNRVESAGLATNERSLKYLAKCGYVQEAIRKNKYFRNGAWVDQVLLVITREMWLEQAKP